MIKFKADGGVTIIENDFIDEYMAEPQSAVFSLIYIYALRCAMGNIEVDNSGIAEKFNILESDVVKAWEYWNKKGIIRLNKGEDYQIEFLNIQKKAKAEVAVTTDKKVVRVTNRPVYKPTEIENVSNENPEIAELFNMAQMLLSKTLSPNDMSLIFGLYDWLGLPLEVIAVLLTYCARHKKPMSYIEKVGIDWAEKGIATTEMAEDYLNMFYSEYKEILKSFGIVGRVANEEEQSYMYTWLKKYAMPLDIIKIACTRAIRNIGQASFKYTDTIIKNWYDKGIKTVEAVEKESVAFNKKNEEKAKSKKTSMVKNSNEVKNSRNNKFTNCIQREYNPDELKDIERMLLDKEARK